MFKFYKKKSSGSPNRRSIARQRQEATLSQNNGTDHQAFQRSRTLTGSMSSSVRTLNETGSHLKSSRVQTHSLMRLRRTVGLGLIGTVVICGLLYILMMQFTGGVNVTIDDSASIPPKSNYSAAIEAYLAGAPFERLHFLLDTKNLTQYVQARYPEVATVTMSGGGGLDPTNITLTMRQPVAQWSVGGQNEYVDKNGVAFRTNYFDDPSVKIIDKSGILPKDEQALISNAFLSFIGQVVGISKSLENLTVTAITIPPETTRQIEVSVAGVSYPARFSTDRPAGEQVEDMARTIIWMQKNNKTPQYIDVRVSGEAFYK